MNARYNEWDSDKGRRSTIPKNLRTWLALFAAQPFSRVATASPFTRIMNVILTDIDILSVARGRPNFPGNPFICHYVVHYQGYLWRMLKLTVDRSLYTYLPSGARNHYIFTSSVIDWSPKESWRHNSQTCSWSLGDSYLHTSNLWRWSTLTVWIRI